MPTQVSGTSQTANPFLDIIGHDTGSAGQPGPDMPADITAALNRMLGQALLPANTPDLFVQATPDPSAGASAQSGVDMAVAYDGAPVALTATPDATDSGGGGAIPADPAAGADPALQSATMSEADIHAALMQLLQSGDRHAVDDALNAADTPPEAKAALVQLKAVMNGERPQLTDSQLEALSILQRHRGDSGGKMEDLQSQIDDPKTPPDLQQALIQMRDDPALQILVDNGAHGGGINKTDGRWGGKDINGLSDLPQLKAYNEKKAASYVSNYIPSDADPSVTQGRDMTENDALREMYLYSDYLPKKLSKKSLQAIVDGNSGMKKCPPQVIAAAKFMLDHPASWSKATENGKNEPSADGSIKRSAFLDNVGRDVVLNDDEASVIKTLDENRDVFFKKAFKRGDLQKLIDDPKTTEENRKAAQKLLDDPLLFGLLDNAKYGHSSSLTKTADDGKIGAGDLDRFMANSTTRGKQALPLPPTHPATTDAETFAIADMAAGEVDDPALKKKKGGGLGNFFHKIGDFLLKAGALVLHGISIALSFFDKIPLLGELAIPLSMAAESVAGGLDVTRTALNGGDVKKALKIMGIGIAGSAISVVAAPGMGAALIKGTEKLAETATVKAVETATEKGVVAASTDGATKAAEKGVTRVTTKGAAKEGEQAATSSVERQIAEGTIETSAELGSNELLYRAQARKPQQLVQGGGNMDGNALLMMQELQQQQQAVSQRI